MKFNQIKATSVSEFINKENQAIMAAFSEASIEKAYAETQKRWGVNLTETDKDGTPKYHFDSPFFSWKSFREGAYKVAENLKEANSETAFGQLLRAGINNIANNWYVLAPTVHEKICSMAVSNKAIELYAPLHRGEVPKQIEKGEVYPETKVLGVDRQILNKKFGMIFSVEKEMIDDDQTGQIMQRARDGGENMKLIESAYAAARFIGTASSYAGQTISASSLSTIWSTTLPAGSGTTANAISYAAFAETKVQALDILLMDMLDLSGNKVLVQPDTLYVGTSLKFPALHLMNSSWYPSAVPINIAGTATSTNVGQMGAYNVMQGLYNVVVDRFLPTKAYAVGQSGRGPVFQRREPLSVIQENPSSGPAFSQDIFRFKTSARWEVDWIESPRFWAIGNNGSV